MCSARDLCGKLSLRTAEKKGSSGMGFITKLVVLVFICSATIQAAEEFDARAIDDYIESKMRLPRIPGMALAIVKDNEIVYLKGYGQADPSGRPMTPQTPLILGSITKSFTALAVMQLVEAGKVELDAPVQKYIPWFRIADANASAQITVRQLLYQTSGLPMLREPQFWTAQDRRALERTVRFLADKQISFPPGQGFEYSNANYETLGLIVQTITGMSFEDYVSQNIFAPLEMKNSFASQDEALKHGMATGHRWWFGVPVAVTFPLNRSELPAGYLISSAGDMAHFMIAELNGGRFGNASVLSSDGIALTHTSPRFYAMGWELLDIDGRRLINHEGGTANFETSVFLDPEAHVGVFVGANVMCALDAFSSPHGNEPLDGQTVRAVALTVLNMTTHRPLPDQGHGIRKLYLLFDLVVLVFTVMLVISIVRMRRRYRWLKERGITRWSIVWAIAHFALPLFVLYLTVKVFFWQVLRMFQPDFYYWLTGVAIVLFVKGLIEIAMIISHKKAQKAQKSAEPI
jgi:CubicO group peptidase (beta-lactamase class C family)